MTTSKSVIPPGDLRRFAWDVVNVSDVERSREFYEEFTPLRVVGTVEARDQRFGGLGVESGSFHGYVLHDATDGTPHVQLVQWTDPAPVGSTYPSHTNPGYFRICFSSTDVATLYDQAIAAGHEPLSPLRLPYGEHITGRPVFSFKDPDGVVLEYVTLPGDYRLYHTNCNVSDLAPAHAFYERVLGLHSFLHATTATPENHSFGPGGDLATYDAHLYRAAETNPDGSEKFAFDVVHSTFPGPTGHVYSSPTNVGIARMAIEVRSVDDAHAALTAAGVSVVAPPEIWDLGDTLGEVKTLVVCSPDGAPMELLEG